ncbi:hypothetical protein RUM43_013779 [Polyplax serrata]|uniref:Uncharacterized protein n=1 Tax=Polyplax serrata TaxID=468196 RepID=A0AAN8P023_POLSC
MSGNDLKNNASVENLGRRNGRTRRSSTVKSTSTAKNDANGVVLLEPLKEYAETCRCYKCQNEIQMCNASDGDKVDEPVTKDGSVALDLDSTSSRSTLKLRARSWPLLLPPRDAKDPKRTEIGSSPVAQVRRLLWRRYYPEGGWGYVVVICCVLVQVLNHGLQLAYGVFHGPLFAKFHAGINQTGKH